MGGGRMWVEGCGEEDVGKGCEKEDVGREV